MNISTAQALSSTGMSAASRRWTQFTGFLCFALAALMLTPTVRAQDKHGDETELEQAMDKMNQAFRKLRRQIGDATKNAESLQLVATLKASAEKSVNLIPKMAADQPADKRDAFVAGYKKKMKEFVAALAPLEEALKAGKNDAAKDLVAKLGAMQKEGHTDYKKKDKE